MTKWMETFTRMCRVLIANTICGELGIFWMVALAVFLSPIIAMVYVWLGGCFICY